MSYLTKFTGLAMTDASFCFHSVINPPELRGLGFLFRLAFVAMWSWSGFTCHCKLLEFVGSVLSITENCLSCPEFICLIARCFPIIRINIIAPLIVPVGDARTTFQCDLFVKESYATRILTSYISPLINRLVQSFTGLNVVSNPCHVCFIMLPPVLCFCVVRLLTSWLQRRMQKGCACEGNRMFWNSRCIQPK